MNCREAEHSLQVERDGALDERGRAALAGHLAACAPCRQRQATLAAALSRLHADAAHVRVPDAGIEWRKVQRQMHEPDRGRVHWARWIAIPATLGAAAALALYVAPDSSTPPTGGERTVARAEAAAPAASAIVFVDDRSGWTFVWSPDAGGQSI